jgi:hypothetical protein
LGTAAFQAGEGPTLEGLGYRYFSWPDVLGTPAFQAGEY